jgi:hypothetical protein
VCISGGGCVWLQSGARLSVCVGAFGRNLASVAVKMFSLLIYFIDFFMNFVLSMCCKDNVAINCITGGHKKRFILRILSL